MADPCARMRVSNVDYCKYVLMNVTYNTVLYSNLIPRVAELEKLSVKSNISSEETQTDQSIYTPHSLFVHVTLFLCAQCYHAYVTVGRVLIASIY